MSSLAVLRDEFDGFKFNNLSVKFIFVQLSKYIYIYRLLETSI